ncbi:MAG: SUMF1/EgtB/PvdO family nonheme iron enzyme, partial [Candidatus Cloacimonetes bacterium]|nr:SUMF1/EgtB/PvdO family nonheme iron enzyme [Candidatus Cloacimonadota bacterium]
LHKDIKPQNVMVSKDNKVKIMDFGIAETVRSSMSRIQNTSSSGTLVYMSPEQLKGKDVGKESDIYSFGAMLYELLNGNPPFYKGDINYQILNEKPDSLENVSDKMNDLIMKCLEKDYKDRFRNFGELKEYIERKTAETKPLSKSETISQPKPKPISESVGSTEDELKPPKQKSKSKKTLTWIIVIILLLISILVILLNTLVWDIKMYEYDSNNSEAQDGLREVKQREDLKEKERIAELERLSKQELLKKANMVFVQGGTFQMGSNENDDEKPIHSVTVSDFYIGKYEVTQKEWKEIMGNNPSNWKGDNLPVEKVSWYDAVEFCNKKSDKESLSRCYSGSRTNIKCNFNANGYRLSTEAEWEYA